MYFPYLRGRQFELISIRELAIEGALDNITPIIEPVKKNCNSLNIANDILSEVRVKPFLIMNPEVGEIPGDNDYFLNFTRNLENSVYRYAFHYSDNAEYILDCIEQYDLSNCMIICLGSFSQKDELRELIENNCISHIVLLEPSKYRSLDRYIKTLNKTYIKLNDLFEKQEKNSDFLCILEHKFSEEHLYWEEEGYQGFGDFTLLPKKYSEGGGMPTAVVIHMTYINESAGNQIWIKHFTSDTNGTTTNVQGKFAEAVTKAIKFCSDLPLKNSATEELKDCYKNKKYPGLGIVKKISIKNHLLIINSFLN